MSGGQISTTDPLSAHSDLTINAPITYDKWYDEEVVRNDNIIGVRRKKTLIQSG